MLKITGGSCRGRNLRLIAGDWIRPTMGRVREALFSMLAPRLAGAGVLDLYAGCGLLGLEALSRGCGRAVFVDADPRSIDLVRKNLQLCGMAERAAVVRGVLPGRGVWPAVRGFAPFDLVFLDPPYRQGLLLPTVQGLHAAGMVATDGVVVAEHEAEWALDAALEGDPTWAPLQSRRYGDTRITLLRYHEHQESGPGS